MSEKRIRIIIVIMTVTLIGIVAVQWFWINKTLESGRKKFEQNVNEALLQVANTLEKKEMYQFIAKKYQNNNHQHAIYLNWNTNDSIINMNVRNNMKQNRLFVRMFENLQDSLIVVDSLPDKSSEKKVVVILENGQTQIIQEDIRFEKIQKKIKLKQKKMENLVEEMLIEYEFSTDGFQIKNRIDQSKLDSLIIRSLRKSSLPGEYDFSVSQNNEILFESANFDNTKPTFRTTLFPTDIFNKNIQLSLHFNSSVYWTQDSNLILMLSASVLLLLLIIGIFTATILIILKQKQTDEIKNDFINNMTHEFKTPIATTRLAVDAITNAKIIIQPTKIQEFAALIRQENTRMTLQIERVLEMALLERNNTEFRLEYLDIHTLLNEAIAKFSLQTQQKNGTITLTTNAVQSVLKIDRLHFINAIGNLIDNALKYTKDAPKVQISTQNTPTGIEILVKDNGIGISKSDKKMVFDRFFRVHTGNLHNVKGFGLGLAYVQKVISAFGGKISLESTLGKGTVFKIFLSFHA